jgi:8-oxo-dGTP diphosphatase
MCEAGAVTIEPPAFDEARRPHGPRDPGDAWVVAPSGERYWGRFGAAGLLAVDPTRGILLQHRVSWSHFGDTWGLPGGARHEGESAVAGAIREAAEEAGVPDRAVRPRATSEFDLGYWSYTTLVADVVTPFDPRISDPESHALEWVSPDDIDGRPLHPGFAASWPALRAVLAIRPALLVDAANVIGSVPDGWWRDRAGAADRLLSRVSGLVSAGLPAEDLGLGLTRWFPPATVVIEGKARAASADVDAVTVVRAEGSGDDELVAQAAALRAAGASVTAVTSDRELVARLESAGASVHGTRWLLDRLPG